MPYRVWLIVMCVVTAAIGGAIDFIDCSRHHRERYDAYAHPQTPPPVFYPARTRGPSAPVQGAEIAAQPPLALN